MLTASTMRSRWSMPSGPSPSFQALTVPVSIFASSGDFDGTQVLNPRVYSRIEMSLRDVEDLLRARAGHAGVMDA